MNDEKYDAKSDSLLEILNYVCQIEALRDSDDKIEENMLDPPSLTAASDEEPPSSHMQSSIETLNKFVYGSLASMLRSLVSAFTKLLGLSGLV